MELATGLGLLSLSECSKVSYIQEIVDVQDYEDTY